MPVGLAILLQKQLCSLIENGQTFTDPNPNSQATDFTATITWGDGNSSPGTVSGSAGSEAPQ